MLKWSFAKSLPVAIPKADYNINKECLVVVIFEHSLISEVFMTNI